MNTKLNIWICFSFCLLSPPTTILAFDHTTIFFLIRLSLQTPCWSVFDSLIYFFVIYKIIHAFLCKGCTHQLPVTWFTNVQLSSQFQQLPNWLDAFLCFKWRYRLISVFFGAFSGNGMFSLYSISGFYLCIFLSIVNSFRTFEFQSNDQLPTKKNDFTIRNGLIILVIHWITVWAVGVRCLSLSANTGYVKWNV